MCYTDRALQSYSPAPTDYAEIEQIHQASQERLDGAAKYVTTKVNALYTGREHVVHAVYFNPQSVSIPWLYPDVGANLFQTRLRQAAIEASPALPTFQVEAITGEAARATEDQNTLMMWAARHGGLKEAARKLAMYGPMGTHVGLFVEADTDKKAPVHKRFRYEALSHVECGFEVGLRRCTWRRYSIPNPESPTQPLQVTDVYWPTAYDSHVRYRFQGAPESSEKSLGAFQSRKKIKGASPLIIKSFLDPAPGEDISPAEVLSWIPLVNDIHSTLEAITEEVGSINNVVLYDEGAISEDYIKAAQSNPVGQTLYIPVTVNAIEDTANSGVSHRMRPVERNSALQELFIALQNYIQLLDDVIGSSALDRGAAIGPRKSAAEASILANAGDRRTKDRLSVMAELFAEAAQVSFSYQREVYGESVDLPLPSGISKILEVPDPLTALMVFRVDAVELGNLSQQGQRETYATATTLVTNTLAQFPNGAPPVVIESLRRLLWSTGARDIAEYLELSLASGGPQDRLFDFISGRTQEIVVNPGDQPDQFIAYYSQKLTEIPQSNIELALALQTAIAAYQNIAAQNQLQAPVGGLAGAIAPGESTQSSQFLEGGEVPIV